MYLIWCHHLQNFPTGCICQKPWTCL